jgi:hypothetical protein
MRAFRRDEARRIVGKEGCGDADIIDADEAARGRLRFALLAMHQTRNPSMRPALRAVRERSHTRMPFGKFRRDIATAHSCGLGNAHDVCSS